MIDGLHIDRHVFAVLARWANNRGLCMQDAIQLAVCAFNERNHDPCNADDGAPVPVLAARLRRVD